MSAKTQSERMFERLRGRHPHVPAACPAASFASMTLPERPRSVSARTRGAFATRRGRPRHRGITKRLSGAPLSTEDLRDLTEARVEIEQLALPARSPKATSSGRPIWSPHGTGSPRSRNDMPANPSGLDHWAAAHAGFHARAGGRLRLKHTASDPRSALPARANAIATIQASWTASAMSSPSIAGSLRRQLPATAKPPKRRWPSIFTVPRRSSSPHSGSRSRMTRPDARRSDKYPPAKWGFFRM